MLKPKDKEREYMRMKVINWKEKKNERRNERRTRICVYKPILFLNQSLLQRKERKRDQELKGKKVIFCEERLTSNVFQLWLDISFINWWERDVSYAFLCLAVNPKTIAERKETNRWSKRQEMPETKRRRMKWKRDEFHRKEEQELWLQAPSYVLHGCYLNGSTD